MINTVTEKKVILFAAKIWKQYNCKNKNNDVAVCDLCCELCQSIDKRAYDLKKNALSSERFANIIYNS